jgi:hypothetical protein
MIFYKVFYVSHQYTLFKSYLHPIDAYFISTAKRRLDRIYYALVEQASQNKVNNSNSNSSSSSSNSNNDKNYIDINIASPSSSAAAAAPTTVNNINRNVIPRIVLDALVESAGLLGMTDRAFATFQEYRTLFHLIPDIHAYNSLLAGVSFCR